MPSFEEAIVNGVLCWRWGETATWKPYTAKELTDRLRDVGKALNEAIHVWKEVSADA